MRIPILLCGFFLAFSLPCTGQSDLVVTVVNPGDFLRQEETIVVPWASILAKAPALAPAAVSVWDTEGEIPCQVIDADADGVPEEFLFQSGFAAHERKHFTIRAHSPRTVFPARVDARFVLPREDLAWENDRIAFRVYGPALAGEVLNGIDVWTKRVRSLIVQKWYEKSQAAAPGSDTYHVDHGEGADFFSVGKSLGAGASGLWKNGTLHQPGVFSSYRILANGPIRAMFRLVYDGGEIEGAPFSLEQTVSLDAGQNLNRIDVVYSAPIDTLVVAAGLVSRKNVLCTSDPERGWMALWGPVNDEPVNEFLGTGIVMPASIRRTPVEQENQHLLLGSSRSNERLTYYAGAGWTRSGDFRDRKEWEATLAGWAHRLSYPLIVTAGSVR